MPTPADPWNEAVAHAVEYATREAAPMSSWATLASLEPRLLDLEANVRGIEAGPHFCATQVWVRSLKPRMVALVGSSRGESPRQREPGEPIGEPLSWGDLMQAGEQQEVALRRRRRRDTRNGRGALWTSDAYDVAYEHLYALLPDCSDDCACRPRGRLHAA